MAHIPPDCVGPKENYTGPASEWQCKSTPPRLAGFQFGFTGFWALKVVRFMGS